MMPFRCRVQKTIKKTKLWLSLLIFLLVFKFIHFFNNDDIDIFEQDSVLMKSVQPKTNTSVDQQSQDYLQTSLNHTLYFNNNTIKSHEQDSVVSKGVQSITDSSVQQQRQHYLLSQQNNTFSRTKPKTKKFFVIHIGPSKTGTSSIQSDSLHAHEVLQKDNTRYFGRLGGKPTRYFFNANKCMDKIIKNEHITTTKLLLLDCWKDEEVGTLEMNIIYSDEGFSYGPKWVKWHVNRIKAIYVDYFDYDEIIVVGGYRRYGEWMKSVYSEWAKMCLKEKCGDWPTKRDVLKNYSPSCQQIWTHIMKHVRTNHYNSMEKRYTNIDTTLAGLQDLSPEITVNILSYFVRPNEGYYNSITTELYCKILGKVRTPRTCDYFKERSYESIRVVNVGSPTMVAYDHILVAAANTATDGSHNWIKKEKTNRCEAQKDLASYHASLKFANKTRSKLLLASSSPLRTMLHLPLLCPPRNELEALLNKSLAFEQMIMPKFYNTPLGKEKHIEEFWEMADKKKSFCHVDTDRLFQNASSWEQVLNERLTIFDWGN